MSFGYSEVLWYLLAVPLGGVILAFAGRRSIKTIEAMTGDYRRKDIINEHVIRYFVTSIFYTAAIAGLILALAEPEWGEVTVEDERRGVELVFLIDVSNSMLAEDIAPSRLSRTREVARAVAGRIADAHTAVIAFKGAATQLVPMTEDNVAFELSMNNVSGTLITARGTNLNDGISAALAAFPDGSPRHQVILLFSDGQELQDSVESLSGEIRIAGIPIIVVQTGTQGGATIPIGNGELLRDESGQPVVAGVDEDVLRLIATLSDGTYLRIDESGIVQKVVDEIYERIGDGSGALFRQESRRRYHLFVVLSLVFLAGSVIVQAIPWGGSRRSE